MLKLTHNDIAECVTAFIARNPLWANKDVEIYFIVNKTAGCFTNKHKSDFYKKLVDEEKNSLANSPVVAKSAIYKVFTTEYAGHTKDLTLSIVSQLIGAERPGLENIIVTAGGDGTAWDCECALYSAAQTEPKKMDAIMNRITLIRLPLGTGNDGTDGHTLEETFEMLRGPLHFKNISAIKAYPEKEPTEEQIKACGKKPEKYCDVNYKAPWYSFNIASIGLDAYVVYLTNTFKKKMPGNLYHLCVPLSGLVYDKDFPSGTAKISYYDKENNLIDEKTTKISLLAFGESGNRIYGGGHHILPDENNVCTVPKVSLPTLIKENHRFVDGSFTEINIAYLHSANKIKIEYDENILMQCDGEVTILTKDHFPLIMEKTEPCLRVISSSKQA